MIGRLSLPALCLFTLLPTLIEQPPASQRQEGQQQPIRVEVEAVNVLVAVTDQNGRFVTDLPKDRFEVREDGKTQKITNFSHETNLPLRIGLLMDTSASVRTKLDFEVRAATNFLRSIMRPQDKTLLVEFDRAVSLISDFSSSPATISEELKKLRAGGGTAMLDAVFAVSRDKLTDPTTRNTIVLLSDGVDLDSQRSLREAVEMAQKSAVIVYAIGTNKFGASGDSGGEKRLSELAEKTGGRAFFPYSPELLEDAFRKIDEELRSQYSLTYTPTNKTRDGKFRKLKIKISDGKELRLRYRPGYYAPTVEPAGSP